MSMSRDRITVISGGNDDAPRKRGGGGPRKFTVDGWQAGLIRDASGYAKGLPHNLTLILENDPALADLFWLDEFGNQISMERQPPWNSGQRDEFTDVDAFELSAWMGSPDRYGMTVRIETVMQAVEAIARRRKRHSLREYLLGLKHDGISRIERLFVDLFGAEESPYSLGLAPCFAVSAVSRILWHDAKQPSKSSKVDFMVVLEGVQGAGKTTGVLELFGASWYAEATESPAHKDFYQGLRGRWVVEVGEMGSFTKADVTKVKQALTTRTDVYRPSYGRMARGFRRECVFVGTTNQSDYLRDETGGRRFLPIVVHKVDVARIAELRDQLWAEAVALFNADFKWWQLPADAQREQDARYSEDVWTERIVRWLSGKAPAQAYENIPLARRVFEGPVNECTVSELLTYAIGIEAGRQDRSHATRIGAVMTRLQWPTYRPVSDGARSRFYYRPDDADG